MTRQLSKSCGIMVIFDFIVLTFSTYYFYNLFNLDKKWLIPTICLTVIAGLFSLFLKDNYKIREFNNTFKNAWLLFEGSIFANIPSVILLYFFIPKTLLAKFLILNILVIFSILKIYRFCFHYYLFKLKKTKKVLIVGTNSRARILAEAIDAKQALKMQLVGFVKSVEIEKTLAKTSAEVFKYKLEDNIDSIIDEKLKEEENFAYRDIKIFEDAKELHNIVVETDADIVIFTQPTILASAVPKQAKIYLMPEFYEMVTGKFYVDKENVYNLALKLREQDNNGIYDFCKRIFDILSASIVLIATLPITAFIAIRVKLLDGGNPLFTQTRVGKNGKTFECYKLRTMYINDYVPKNAAMLNDGSDRVIPFCKIIRKAKLDEIPQMINILKGEMSIVGPRAEWEKFVNVFKNDIPFYEARMWVKTGWTGWAHVSMPAAYSVDEEKERLAYDLYYIKYRNIFLDLSILVKAVFLAISGRHM